MIASTEPSELSKMTVAEMLRHFMTHPADQFAISQFLGLKDAMALNKDVQGRDFEKVGIFVTFLQAKVSAFSGGHAELEAFFLNGVLGRQAQFSECLRAQGDVIKRLLNDLTDQQFKELLTLSQYLMVTKNLACLADVIDLYEMGEERVIKLILHAIEYLCQTMPLSTQRREAEDFGNVLNALLEAVKRLGLDPSKLDQAYSIMFPGTSSGVLLEMEKHNLPILTFLLSNKVPMDKAWLAERVRLQQPSLARPEPESFIALLKKYDLYYRYEACLVEVVYARSLSRANELDPGHKNSLHTSHLSEGLELSPLHIALLHNRSILIGASGVDPSVGLGLVTRLASNTSNRELLYGENVLHLAIAKERKWEAIQLLAHAQLQGINLIDTINSLGQTPLHCLALRSHIGLTYELMTKMIECGPELMVEDNQGTSLIGVFSQHAPQYLPQLLYHGAFAYGHVAQQLQSMILAVAQANNESLVDAKDQEFIAELSALSINLLSEQYIEQALAVYTLCERYFTARNVEHRCLSQKITEHMQANDDLVLQALLSLRNVTSLGHELAFQDALWTPAYFSAWCAAWKSHSPHRKVNPFEVLPASLLAEVTPWLDTTDIKHLQLLSRLARTKMDACLYPQSLLDEIDQRFPECSVKQALKAEQAALIAEGRGSTKEKILALTRVVTPSLFNHAHGHYSRFLAIMMNRAFSLPLDVTHWHLYKDCRTGEKNMVSDLFFIAAVMRRAYHFKAMLQVSNGLGVASNRVTQVLAATGQLSLLRALANIETAIPLNTNIWFREVKSLQCRVSWNGVPDDIGRTYANRIEELQAIELLPGEHLELERGTRFSPHDRRVVRVASQSPLMASLVHGQHDVMLFLACLDAVQPSYEEILCAKRCGYDAIYERLVNKVPKDSPVRVQLLSGGIMSGKLSAEDSHQLILRLLPRLKNALYKAGCCYPDRAGVRYTLSALWHHTTSHRRFKQGLMALGDVSIEHTSSVEFCEMLHSIVHNEVFNNDDVRGSDLMRFIIEEIHKDAELCTGMNLRQLPGGAVIHDEIFNRHLPTIQAKMPPTYAPKPGEKPSIAYRNFFRAYLRAVLSFWKSHLEKMAPENEGPDREPA